MRSTPDSITFPLMRRGWESGIIGGMLMVYGIIMGFGLLLEQMIPPGKLILGLLTLAVTGVGAVMVLNCCLRLHLVTEGVAVSLFGWTVRKYPAEALGLFCRYERQTMDNMVKRYLCVCAMDSVGPVGAREIKYHRDSADRRKARGDWQEVFALEQVRRTNLLGRLFPAGKYVLWLEDSPAAAELLGQMYPDVPWLDRRKDNTRKYWSYSSEGQRRLDAETPVDFLRCHPALGEAIGTLPLLIAIIPTAVLCIGGILLSEVAEWPGLILMGSALVWLFGVLILMDNRMGGKERVSLEPGGIRLRRKGREEVLVQAEQMHTLWRFQLNAKGGPIRYLALTTLELDDLARMEEAQMEKTARGRETLDAFRFCEDWQAIAARRCILRRAENYGYGDRELLLIAHTENRERWLRERYPHLTVYEIDD